MATLPRSLLLPPTREEALEELRQLVDEVRPRGDEAPCARIQQLTDRLDDEPALRARLTVCIHALFARIDAVDTLTDAGILAEGTLLPELVHRLARRVLPPTPKPDSLHEVLRELFPHKGDAAWLSEVPPDCWARLQDALDLRVDPTTPIPAELALAIRVLAHRVAALGLRPVLTERVPELSPHRGESPFLVVSDQVLAYIRAHGNGRVDDEVPALLACQSTLDRCRQAILDLRARKHEYGTSLELTALSFRMQGLIERLELLLALTDPRDRNRGRDIARVVAAVVQAEEERDRLGLLVKQHADLLVYQVVEHAARKGRKYITSTRAEYGRFLLTSMGGGAIVAVFAVLKVKLAILPLSLASQALVYGLNYAICFALIYLTGATLATKQPAVTAHTLAACLDDAGGARSLGRLVEMIARAARSQLVSIFGNVAVAFPLGLLFAVAWPHLFGMPLASPDKAAKLVDDLHPWLSASAWYAAVAGVFLFSAGVISGWVDNRLVFSRIPERIAAHPVLVRILGEPRARGAGEFTRAKAGALVGNVVLGFCLGSAGTIGHIVGLPFDIRHIAFSSSHLAIGLHGLDFGVPLAQAATVGAGVAMIGAVNLVVSFGLAVLLAVESRRLTLREGRRLLWLLGVHLLRHPLDFVFPPRQPTTD